jgi:hypothetical protein
MNLIAFTGGNVCYNLYDTGLANLLGVETLNHGTNGLNYLRIRLFGGDPSQGGKSSGSTDKWCDDNTKNFFYMFKDTDFQTEGPFNGLTKNLIATPFIGKRVLPRLHCFLSGYNFNARLMPQSDFVLFRYTRIFFGTMGGITHLNLVPTLRFRFRQIDPNRLKNDPAYGGLAYRTTEKVEVWRLGMMGTILTGVNLNWFSRVKAHPLKVATGIVQLTCAVALTLLMLQHAQMLAVYAVAGALLA